MLPCPKLSFENLSRGIPGQGIDELHRTRCLVVRDPIAAKGDDLGFRQACAFFFHHECLHCLSGNRVRNPDYGSFHYAVMLRQEFLNFSRPLVPLAVSEVDLADVARDVVRLHEGSASDRSVRLSVEAELPIQGTAADLLKIGMIRVRDRIAREGLPARMLLTVHDELVFEVERSAAQDLGLAVRAEMEGAIQLDVPVEVVQRANASSAAIRPVARLAMGW